MLVPVISQDDLRKTLAPQYWTYLDKVGIHSLLAVPLRAHGKIIGNLAMSRQRPDVRYTAADQTLVGDLAERAAMAIQNAQLHRALGDALAGTERQVIERTQEIANGNAELVQRVGELERAHASLRASESHFRAVTETASEGIVSADGRGNIIYFNRGAERMFGFGASEVLGKPLTILMPERFREPHLKGLARFLGTGEAHVIGKTVELAGRRNDGTEFPIELSLATWSAAGDVFLRRSSVTSPSANACSSSSNGATVSLSSLHMLHRTIFKSRSAWCAVLCSS